MGRQVAVETTSDGMPGQRSKQIAQLPLRVPKEWAPRIDAIALALSRPGIPIKQSDALRHIVALGLDAAEAQLGLKHPRKR